MKQNCRQIQPWRLFLDAMCCLRAGAYRASAPKDPVRVDGSLAHRQRQSPNLDRALPPGPDPKTQGGGGWRKPFECLHSFPPQELCGLGAVPVLVLLGGDGSCSNSRGDRTMSKSGSIVSAAQNLDWNDSGRIAHAGWNHRRRAYESQIRK